MEVRQREGIGPQSVPQRCDPSTLELVLILVPHLSDAALGLEALRGLASP